MRQTLADGCASVVSGHAAAVPPSRVMNSRRLMGSLSPKVTAYHIWWNAALCITANLATDVRVGSIASHRQAGGVRAMSASPPIATKNSRSREAPLCANSGLVRCSKKLSGLPLSGLVPEWF